MPRLTTTVSLAASLAATLASLAGCGGGGSADCSAIYAIEKKCEKDFDMPKGTFMSACSAASSDPESKDEVASMARCAKSKDCGEYEQCQQAARGARRAKDVEKSLAEGKVKDAFDDCTISPEYFADASFKAACAKVMAEVPTKLAGEEREKAMDRCRYSPDLAKVPEIAAVCTTLAKGELARLTEGVTKARDAGTHDYRLCSELENIAKNAGGDVKAAETLCKESQAAEQAAKGAAEARANAAAKKADLPYQCSSATDDLDALGTEWSKKAKADLTKACYVELGLVIFEAKAAEAKYSCPYEITQVLEAAAKHGLVAAHPELDAGIKKLPKLCQAK